MMTHSATFVATSCLLAALAGCGSDDGDEGAGAPAAGSDGGAQAADRALAQLDCFIGLEVPGLDVNGSGCSGTSTASTVTMLRSEAFEAGFSLTLRLNAPPAIGPLDLAELTLEIPEGTATPTWNLPVDACTAVAVSSKLEPDFDWTYYRIDISCTAPATPAADNPQGSREVGSFSIVTFFSS